MKPNQLKDSTPCTKWNVQALMDHIAAEGVDYFYAVLSGTQPAATKPGSGNLARYDEGVKKVLMVAKAKGAMEKTVQGPVGPMPAGQFLMMAFRDTVVHGWDLARATKQDTKMDAKHAETLCAIFDPMADKMRDPQFFGPRVKVPANASAQDKLLGALGRKP